MKFDTVRTTCPYCAVGCNLLLMALDGEIVGVRPANGPSNEGKLCIKGWNVAEFVQHPVRLKKPLVRRDGALKEASWDEALDRAATELNRIKTTYGPESVAFTGSARCVNEETYVFQKFARAVFGHNSIDHCARL